MVARHDRALNLEQILWVPHVLDDVVRHFCTRFDDVRECLSPRPQHGIGFVPRIQADGPFEGIDDGFH